jgi:hypothetical protein
MHQQGKMSIWTRNRGSLVLNGGTRAAKPANALQIKIEAIVLQKDLPGHLLAWVDRNRWLLWAVMVGFYLAAFNGQWRIQPDAALFLSIGRNLANGKGFTYLGQPNHLAYPGWPVLIAASFKLFGTRSLVPAHLLMLLMALGTVAATYRLFLIHAGRPTAVAISLGVGLTKAFFCYGFELWSDMPFAMGVMCALAGYEGMSTNHDRPIETRRPLSKLRLDLLFLIGGLLVAAAMRPTIWPLLAAMLLAGVFRAVHRQSWKWATLALVAGLFAVVGICLMFGWIRPGSNSFGGVYEEYLVNRITGHGNDVATHSIAQNVRDLFSWAASDVLFQTRLGPICNSLLSVVVLGLGFGLFRYRVLWGLWFCLLLATILISQATLDRYFLPVLPLLVFAWWELLVGLSRALPRQWANIVFLGLLGFGTLLNVTKVCGIIAQQREHPFLANYDQGRFDGIPEFAKKINDRVGDKAFILVKAPYGRVTAFLSDRFATSAANTSVSQLKNWHVFVVEPSDQSTQDLLKSAGLAEGSALFTVRPSAGHGPWATALSLHPTHPVRQ